jgi:hypothetical protein
MKDPRRFPPPWSVEEQEARFVVRDHNGQQLADVYFDEEPSAANLVATRLDRSVPSAVGSRSTDNRPEE